MDQFKNPLASHEHSLELLKQLYEYDSFMDSLRVVADMGCGTGHDINWFGSLWTRDDPPEPHNYICYGVDKTLRLVDPEIRKNPNITFIENTFEQDRVIPRDIDFIWCHDAFQYAVNPLNTLKNWYNNMSLNGMLMLSIPMHQSYHYNRLVNRSVNGCYYTYNIVNLMYMLAVNGFDCKDCYFNMSLNDSWLTAAVYKTDVAPMDPATTTWYDLAEQDLLNDSAVASLNTWGHVRQEDLIFMWLNKDWRLAKN